jgi:hypothetical protein
MSWPVRRLTGVVLTLLLGTYAVALVALSSPASAQGTVTVTIQGRGTVTADGISCSESGGDCSQAYADTQDCDPQRKPPCINIPPDVDLVAQPDRDGYVFDHFTGCTPSGPRTCSLTVVSNTTVTAVFHDAAPPTVTLTQPTSGFQRGTIPLAATATDNAGVVKVEFLFRGVVVRTVTSPPYSSTFDTTTVPDGVAAVGARAVDTSANQSGVAASTITVDNSPPSLSVTGPGNQTFGPGSTQTWDLTVDDATSGIASVACSVVPAGQADSFAPCSGGSSSHSVTGLGQGAYVFHVRATDNAGNVSEATRTFTVDTTPPETTITSGPADGVVLTTRGVAFGVSGGEPGAVLGCRLYRTGTTAPAFAPCTTASSFAATGLGDGGYLFEARATDAVGNVDPTPVSRTFTVDASPPTVSITEQPKRTVKTKKKKVKVSFGFTASEPGATFRCSLDGGAFTACPAAASFTVKVGRHTLSVVAVDAAGNVSPTPREVSWKVKRVKKQH